MGIAQLVDRAWEGLPRPVKDGAKSAWAGYARLTSASRLLPDYIIIGTQRAGTTSLYKYLVRHPAIAHALTKELRFFDLHYERGFGWYRSRFPSARHRERLRRAKDLSMIVGESSPDYLFHPYAPGRIARALPDVKLVVLLRNPVDRAYSHYWHQAARGFEPLGFEEAIERETERLAGELERMLEDERYVSYERHHHSYLSRGVYVDQLRTWFDLFAREQFLILRSEDLFVDPPAVYRQVLEFLGAPPWELREYETFNAFSSGSMNPATRARLVEHFRPHNARLADLLGRDPGWDA